MHLTFVNLGQHVIDHVVETSLPSAAGIRIDKDGLLPEWYSIRQYATTTLAPTSIDLWPEFQADPSQTGTHPTDGWLGMLPPIYVTTSTVAWSGGHGRLNLTGAMALANRWAWPPMRPGGPWFRFKFKATGADAANFFTYNFELLLLFE